jgi:lysophospholipase L1-like esterase
MKAYVIANSAVTADTRFPENNPDNRRYRRRLLAEGDSWFSMGGVPYENMLFELDFPESTIVVNIAHPGDEIVEMASPSHVKEFKRLVTKRPTSYDWHAILLSGGGNDVIDRAVDIIESGNTVDECIDRAALQTCMNDVANGYRTLAALRDSSARPNNVNAPLIVHTYDYPTPRESPAEFFGKKIRGPWLIDVLEAKGVAENLWIPISEKLIDALAQTILDLANGPNAIRNFRVVDTRGTLVPADLGTTGNSNDWRNEIHPNSGGYKKLVEMIAEVVP